jgi:ABC-2 type transport system permease protein
MSTLVGVEIRRLLSRRVVRFVAATALFGMLLAGVVLFVRSHHVRAGAEADVAAKVQALHEREVADCARNTRPADLPPGLTPEEFCQQVIAGPTIPDPEFHLTHYRDVAEGLSGLFIAILFVLGATSAGAEWHAGTVTTQLTWEPRRAPLLLAKALAAALAAFVAFWLVEAVLFGVLAPAAIFRGTTAGVDAQWLRATLEPLLRASAVAAMAAASGHALAWLARNTAVAVGAVLGYAAVLEPLLRAVRPKWEPWFLVSNAVRFITGHPLDFTTVKMRSTTGAAVLLAAYTVGLVAVSVAVFRRRDVT